MRRERQRLFAKNGWGKSVVSSNINFKVYCKRYICTYFMPYKRQSARNILCLEGLEVILQKKKKTGNTNETISLLERRNSPRDLSSMLLFHDNIITIQWWKLLPNVSVPFHFYLITLNLLKQNLFDFPSPSLHMINQEIVTLRSSKKKNSSKSSMDREAHSNW